MCDCLTSDCGCSELSVPIGPRGFQGPPGITPQIIFLPPSALPPGSTPTIQQTGGPATYNVAIGIPSGLPGIGTPGANGANGINAFTVTTSLFTVPGIGLLTSMPVQLAEYGWVEDFQWVYIPGAGYFEVYSVNTSQGITLRNPGPAQGFPSSGIPGNAAVNTQINIGTAVTPGGRPGGEGPQGPIGTPGTPGADALLLVTNTFPVSPPLPGRDTVIYTDSATTPTFTLIYEWTGAAWVQRANIQGAAGTQIVNTPGDPNVTLPAGPIGTYAVRTDVPSIYVKTGISSWSPVVTLTPTFNQVAIQSSGNFGTTPTSTESVIGFVDEVVVLNTPGTYTFDLAYQGYDLSTDKAIQLDWSDSAYGENAMWVWRISNTDAASIAITYATGSFDKKTGLALPATLAAGETQVYHLMRNGAKILIYDTYVAVAV